MQNNNSNSPNSTSNSTLKSNKSQTNELSRFGHSVIYLNSNNAILCVGAKGLSSHYEICNDTYIFKIKENTWVKINPVGDIPCARAAHSACAIDINHMAIYGGATLNGILAPDELYVLDLNNEENNSKWIKLKNSFENISPGKRYGHSMVFYAPYVIIFGGNLGNQLSNDVYISQIEENNILKNEINWHLLKTIGPTPSPRMYHSCALCKYGGASNMIILFGGRTENNVPLNDCWGLRKHRNGNWDWVKAPYAKGYEPHKRFQHTVNFYFNFLIVIGGRNDYDQTQIPIEIYDTDSSEWESVAFFNKFRHTSWVVENSIFTQGGFQLSNTLVAQYDIIKIDLAKLFNSNENLKKKFEKLAKEIEERNKKLQMQNSKKITPTLSPINGVSNNPRTTNPKNVLSKNNKKDPLPMQSLINNKPLIMKNVEMAMVSSNPNDKLIIKPIQIDEEGNIENNINVISNTQLCDKFIEYLLRPEYWLKEDIKESKDKFHFTIDEIAALTKQCMKIVNDQPNILKVSAPVKVFGDIHGQYLDLMNFFIKWGCPSEGLNGDIISNDYLFLGDYVDRGNMSLETICLLMALKVKYPDQIHLIRGNHEDILINSSFGFMEECEKRLDDDSESDDSLFTLINNFFEYLPFVALIEDQILCVHGGIGGNVKKLEDIDKIQRPFNVVHEAQTKDQKLVMDMLWSDPTDNDEEVGILPNYQRDSNGYGNIVKFGPDIVKKFLHENKLSYIMRAHECVLDGFERFAGGLLITVFSATDYCGRHGNAGAMIIINQHMQMIPHLIYPPEGGNNNWIDDEEYLKKRPPTPPRIRYNKQTY